MNAIFVRHGQTTGNSGLPCHDLALLQLTELGWQQAKQIAADWTEKPDLIVTSPYLRTKQTAAATLARFPNAPVEVWPIQEFTYLEPSRWNGTLSAERMPFIERYWTANDPDFCDGDGAETFSNLLRRSEAALERLRVLPEHFLVYVFSHGQFIQAVRSLIVDCELDVHGKMRKFWHKGTPTISNAQRVELHRDKDGWRTQDESAVLGVSR